MSEKAFPGKTFPNYCRGTGYLLSLDVATSIAAVGTLNIVSLRKYNSNILI